MNALATFPSPTGTELRTLMRDGEPWFIAADVCAALDMNLNAGTSRWTAGLNDGEKTTLRIPAGGSRSKHASAFTRMTGINESGFYKLVMKSRKPEARKFQDWVTGTVLPALRKDGGYIVGEEKVVTGEMSDDELLARALQVSAKKLERLTLERDAAQAKAVEAQAKVIEVEALSAKFSERATGLEPAEEVSRFRSLDEAAEWFKLDLDHGMRCRLGQTLGQFDRIAGRAARYETSPNRRRLYPMSAIRRAVRIHDMEF